MIQVVPNWFAENDIPKIDGNWQLETFWRHERDDLAESQLDPFLMLHLEPQPMQMCRQRRVNVQETSDGMRLTDITDTRKCADEWDQVNRVVQAWCLPLVYRFYSKGQHNAETCKCPVSASPFARQDQVDRIRQIMGNQDITHLQHVFQTRYTHGCFLSTHRDPPESSIAFVYSLTKDWKAQNGGLLHFVTSDGTDRNVERVILPEYNSMVLFDLSVDRPHFVSAVTAVGKCRDSYVGWYGWDK